MDTTSDDHHEHSMQKRMTLLHAAIDDLKEALHNVEEELKKEEQERQSLANGSERTNGVKRNSNSGLKKQCKRSLGRLQKEFDRQERRERKKHEKACRKELQAQQKKDVLRLLLSRHQNGKVLHGEAFFLLEWNWWVKWCRYVDFFDVGTTNGKETKSNADQISEKTRLLLAYFPVGASLPSSLREDHDDDMVDDSLDSSDDEESTEIVVPGPIDNAKLLADSDDLFFRQWYHPTAHNNTGTTPSLKPNLIRGYHYEILPREVYSALRSWYGETTPTICRRTTESGTLIVYPTVPNRLKVQCLKAPRCSACRAPGATFRCGKCLMVQYCDRACQEAHWSFHRPYCRPRPKETQNEGGKPSSLSQIPFPSEGGRVGLNNLGNTCFMNSALQSLSHATPLTRHFLSNQFKSDLNKGNPLGTGGKLAIAYEAFLKDVWMKQDIASISPTTLKRAIALFAPRFANYQQHDAQEFLAYLLDGLHEDLNRIRRAPYVEMPDVTDGQNMTIAAAEAWIAHKRRNDSMVMDTFYGQFQSTCVCPKCRRVSVSFDTFNHVSLEIPSNQPTWATIVVPVLVHFADGSRKPVRYAIKVKRQGFVLDLRKGIANLSQIVPEKLVLTDVYKNSIYKLLDDKESLSTINAAEDNIVAYEVTPYTVKDTLHIIVSHCFVQDGNEDNENGENNDASNSRKKDIGLPFMTSIDSKNSTCHDLWELMSGFGQRIVKSLVDTGDKATEEISEDSMDITSDCQLDGLLSIQFVDAQGKSRFIFEESDGDKASDYLPHKSEELLSKFLGQNCAENFLFLNMVWNNPTATDDKAEAVIDPKRFLDFDSHPTLVDALREKLIISNSNPSQGVSLNQCFQSFSRPERLDTENMWYCSKCKQHVQALKTMKLWRLPNILVIHLKRFEYKNALRRDKLGTFVDFPLAGLDMNPHCASRKSTEHDFAFADITVPADYDLFAVVNHYGRLGFGHYTAFAMQWDETGISKTWNAFDDSNVRPISPNEIKSAAAYILFYRRRTFH